MRCYRYQFWYKKSFFDVGSHVLSQLITPTPNSWLSVASPTLFAMLVSLDLIVSEDQPSNITQTICLTLNVRWDWWGSHTIMTFFFFCCLLSLGNKKCVTQILLSCVLLLFMSKGNSYGGIVSCCNVDSQCHV